MIYNSFKKRLIIIEEGKDHRVISGEEAEQEFRRIEYLTRKEVKNDSLHAEIQSFGN